MVGTRLEGSGWEVIRARTDLRQWRKMKVDRMRDALAEIGLHLNTSLCPRWWTHSQHISDEWKARAWNTEFISCTSYKPPPMFFALQTSNPRWICVPVVGMISLNRDGREWEVYLAFSPIIVFQSEQVSVTKWFGHASSITWTPNVLSCLAIQFLWGWSQTSGVETRRWVRLAFHCNGSVKHFGAVLLTNSLFWCQL